MAHCNRQADGYREDRRTECVRKDGSEARRNSLVVLACCRTVDDGVCGCNDVGARCVVVMDADTWYGRKVHRVVEYHHGSIWTHWICYRSSHLYFILDRPASRRYHWKSDERKTPGWLAVEALCGCRNCIRPHSWLFGTNNHMDDCCP